MVAIFTGVGAGFTRGSGNILGGGGLLGSGSFGRGGENVSVNAATGNLLISQQDEFLTGKGLDASIGRTYNSFGEAADGDNGDNWQQTTTRRVFGLTGTQNTAGSTIKRQGADGAVVTYIWDASKSAYLATDGDGAHDELRKVAGNWVWTDGASRFTDTYGAYGTDNWRIISATGKEYFGLTFTYIGDKLDKVTTANGEYTQYTWSGNNITQIVTSYTDLATSTARTLTRTRYAYDGSNRLTTVTVDLSPEDSHVGDGKTFVTTYTYDGASTRVASIATTGGSLLEMTYDGSGRVLTLTETVATGVTRVTTLSYQAGYTTVTGPDTKVTRLDYDALGRLTKITLPLAVSGATAQTVEFGYDASGNVTSVKDSAGEITSYTHDASGNILTVTNPNSNVTTRTYSAKNEMLTETRNGSDASGAAVSHTTRYAYDSYSHLRYIVSAEGHVTEYEWASANQYWTTEYPQQAYDLTGLSSTTAITEGQLTTWRTTFNNTRDKITFDQFDTRGNLIKRTRYGSGVTNWGNGSTAEGYSETFYSYDQAGRLLSRYDNGVLAETFVYDGLGRAIASADPANGLTTFRFDDANMTTIVHYAAGLTQTKVYNKAGELLSDTSSTPGYQPDEIHADLTDWPYSGTTRTAATPINGKPTYTYTLNATGSPGVTSKSMVVAAGETVSWRIAIKGDPADAHRIGLHGSVNGWGTIAGTDSIAVVVSGPGKIDNVGTYGGMFDVTELSLTQETIVEIRRTFTQTETVYGYFYVGVGASVPAGTAVTLGATNMTRAITDVDEAIASSVAYRYDTLGRVRMVTSPLGVASTGNPNDYNSFILYDDAGRKTADIAADGSIVEYRYDVANRLAATIAYATKLNATQMGNLATAGGIAEVATYRPGANAADIWNWNVYDDAGRLIQSIDGNGGVVDFYYDNSNQLIRTVGYSAKVTVTSFKTTLPTARQTVTTGTEDRVSRTFYDQDGRLIGTLSGEGYLSEIVYDKAGQKVEEIAYATKPAVSWTTSSFNQLRTSAGTAVATNRRVRYVYDGQGLLRYQVDGLGNVSRFEYDLGQRLTTTIAYAAAISPTDFTYATVKAAVTAIANDSTDRKSWSVYNDKGQVAYAIDAGGFVTAFVYDAGGRAIKAISYATDRATTSLPTLATMGTWAAGQASNALNRISRTYYSAGGVARFTVDAEGYRAKSVFDANGNLLSTTLSANALTVTDSTTISQLDAMSGGTALTTSFTYDPTGRLLTTTNAEAGVTTYEYNAFGQVAKITDPHGQSTGKATYNYYDAAGRLTMVRDAEDYVNQTTYNSFGEVASVTRYYNKTASAVTVAPTVTPHAKDAVTFYYYDDLGRLTYTVDAEKGVTRSYYDGFGEVAKVVRYATTYNATGSTTIAQLDANFGAESAAPPASASVTSFTYDNLGRVTASTDALTASESYGYNAFGDRTSVTNKLGGVTTYAYDKRGLLTSETLPISSYLANGTVQGTIVNTYGYDAFGNRTQMVEGSGLTEARTTSYEYDRLGRLKKTLGQARTVLDQADHKTETVSFVPTEEITYDAAGNVIRVVDAASNRSVHFYDDIGRKIVTIDAAGTYTRYAYDANGNVTSTRVYETSVTVPANGGADSSAPAVPGTVYRETLFEYDNLGRLTKSSVTAAVSGYPAALGSWNGTSWVAGSAPIDLLYQYDSFGNVAKATDANGNATWSYYDKLGRKTVQIDALNYRTDWTYDHEGNVVVELRSANQTATPSSVETPPSVTANSAADRETRYTYDKNGNRLSEERRDVVVHNDASPGTTTIVHAKVEWLYNALGQVTRKTEATGDQTNYSYDTGGRLTQEQRAAFTSHQGTSVTPTVDYRYNGLGDLVRTVAAGAGDAADRITTYAYGAGGLLASMTDAEGYVHSYAYDKRGIQIRDQYSRVDSAGTATTNGVLTKVDMLGRTIEQSVGSWNGTVWTKGDIATTEYNSFGEVKRSGINGLWQTENLYDAAGRLRATNGGDGVWKAFGYDKNGNQTVAITLSGTGDSLSGLTFAQAVAKISQANVNATYTVYDKRNMATSAVEEGRQLSTTVIDTITTSRIYNAFGEALTETDALGYVTTYSYNKAGRMVRREAPTVEVVYENGASQYIKPSEDYYYDRSGRLVAQRDANGTYAAGGDVYNGASKNANTGNLTRLFLLAGTGYDGGQAMVRAQIAADNGVKITAYDIHGDARRAYDELNTEIVGGAPAIKSSAVYDASLYDKLGRVTQVTQTGGLVDTYTYDILGQRLTHWNNFLGSGDKETTDYDLQGRVTTTRAFGGDRMVTSYSWDATIAAISGVTTGGWTELVQHYDGATYIGHQSSDKSDIYGRITWKSDLGSHQSSYTYDVAGRQTGVTMGGSTTSFAWYNSGQLKENSGLAGVASYSYDKLGQRLTEKLVLGGTTLKDQAAKFDALGRMTIWSAVGTGSQPPASITHKYDAVGNIRHTHTQNHFLDQAGNPFATASEQHLWYRFDSMNRLVTDKGQLSGTAGAAGTQIVRGYNGAELTYGGRDILYDAAGRRVAVLTTRTTPGQWYGDPYDLYNPPYYEAGTFVEQRESYSYDAAGRLTQTHWSQGAPVYEGIDPGTGGGTYTPSGPIPSAPAGGALRSSYSYDLMGRVTLQQDYEANGTVVAYSRSAWYNAKGQLLEDYTSTKKGSDIFTSRTGYDYGVGTGYAMGSVVQSASDSHKNGDDSSFKDVANKYSFLWYDSAVQYQIVHDKERSHEDYGAPYGLVQGVALSDFTNDYTTTFSYNAFGQLTSAYVGDGMPKTVTFTNDELGQIIRRDETRPSNAPTAQTGSPHEVWYRFGGRQMGYTGNNGTSDVSTAASITERTAVAPTTQGTFRGGATFGSSYKDFALSYDPLNSYNQGSAGGAYTVQAGDTLSSIAQRLYGDSNLWYKLAEANGMSSASALVEGQTLTLPTGVARNTHNAGTFDAYDPSEAIGELSPTTPKPSKKPKCGGFGMILIAVIAMAVATVVTAGAASALSGQAFGAVLGAMTGGAAVGSVSMGAWVAAGAVGGAIGSMASQGIGVATGIQDKFSWKGVAMAGIGGAVGGYFQGLNNAAGVATKAAQDAAMKAGTEFTAKMAQGAVTAQLGGVGSFLTGGGFVNTVTRSVLSNVAIQGVAVATGLQSKFDFAGVAAAGAGATIGYGAGKLFGAAPISATNRSVGAYATNFATGAASLIANAATRTAISGGNFGDNIMRGLPDVIAQTIGEMVVNGVVEKDSIASRLKAAGASSEEVRLISREAKKRGISLDGLMAIAQAGDKISPDAEMLARSYVEQMRVWSSEVDAGEYAVDRGEFRKFEREMAKALIAIDVYRDDSDISTLPKGYYRLSDNDLRIRNVDPEILIDKSSSLFSAVYQDGDGGYIIAYRGSQFTWGDWKTNIYQDFGWKAAQYEHVATNAQALVDALGGDVSFVGHSLGGGLATLAALITGRPAQTLAPAPLRDKTLKMYNVYDAAQEAKDIRSFTPIGEILSVRNAISSKHIVSGEANFLIPSSAVFDDNGMISTDYDRGLDAASLHTTNKILPSLFYTRYMEIFNKNSFGEYVTWMLESAGK